MSHERHGEEIDSDTDPIQAYVIESLDQVREATHSQEKELVKLNLRVANMEALLEKINATIHEGHNGKEPILTRIALAEDALGRMRRREKALAKDSEVTALAGVAGVKGKWHFYAILAPGILAVIGHIVNWTIKTHG